jgi:hypothetical protein
MFLGMSCGEQLQERQAINHWDGQWPSLYLPVSNAAETCKSRSSSLLWKCGCVRHVRDSFNSTAMSATFIIETLVAEERLKRRPRDDLNFGWFPSYQRL